MICKFCGAELEDGCAVCPVCEKALDETVTEEVSAEEAVQETVCQEPQSAEQTPSTEETEAEQAAPDWTAPAAVPQKKNNTAKLIIAIVCGVVLGGILTCAVLAGIGFSVLSNFLNKEPAETTAQTTEGVTYDFPSYTVDDETAIAAADKVVATAGDMQLTNAQLQIYYRMEVMNFLSQNMYYLSYFGLDYTQPLSQQPCIADETMSWEQYFLNSALDAWHLYTSLLLQAQADGYVYSAEDQAYIDGIPQQTLNMIADSEFATVEDMIHAEMGASCTPETYYSYMENSYKSVTYYNSLYEGMTPTREEMELYYTENPDVFTAQGAFSKEDGNYVNVRHILICPQGGTKAEDGSTTYSDEEWAAAQAKAEEIYNAWKNGEATEDSFSKLATEKSEDPGSQSKGGLYEDVYVGQMVPEFNDWCFDDSRKVGDHGIVKTSYGYHIMYFSGVGEEMWLSTAQKAMLEERSAELLQKAMESFPMEKNYDNIVLCDVAL